MLFGLLGSRDNPKGPSFKRARKLVYDYSGNKLGFMAPNHNITSYSANIGRPKSNLYNESEYGCTKLLSKTYYGVANSYREDWQFVGLPLVQGYLGRMAMSLSVSRVETKGSLFDKTCFEKELLDEIDNTYGPFSTEQPWNLVNRFKAPLNWCGVNISGVDWLYYEMKEKKGYKSYCVYATPLTDAHYCCIKFEFIEKDLRQFCRDAFETLMQNILSTLTLELSPESQRQKAEIEKQYPNQQYSDFQPVFEWPEFETLKPEEDEFEKAYREVRQSIDGFEA